MGLWSIAFSFPTSSHNCSSPPLQEKDMLLTYALLNFTTVYHSGVEKPLEYHAKGQFVEGVNNFGPFVTQVSIFAFNKILKRPHQTLS